METQPRFQAPRPVQLLESDSSSQTPRPVVQQSLPDWYRPTARDVAAGEVSREAHQLLQRLRNIASVAAATTNPTTPKLVVTANSGDGPANQESYYDYSNQRFHAAVPPVPEDYDMSAPKHVAIFKQEWDSYQSDLQQMRRVRGAASPSNIHMFSPESRQIGLNYNRVAEALGDNVGTPEAKQFIRNGVAHEAGRALSLQERQRYGYDALNQYATLPPGPSFDKPREYEELKIPISYMASPTRRMFPAHAGMIRYSPCVSPAAASVPRTRGDDPINVQL